MADHKNKNLAKGNFCIYQISVFKNLFKFGKADMDRTTATSGDPTRIHQQVRKLAEEYGEKNVFRSIIQKLFGKTTSDAKELEKMILQNHFEQTGEIPEGNKKSFKPKKS